VRDATPGSKAKRMPRTPSATPHLATTRAKTRAEWRRWLAKNHDQCAAVLLIYARKGSGEPSVTWDESVDEALCYGWVDGVRGKLDETHFTVRFTPRKPTSIWSKLNLERVARLALAGKMHPAGLAKYEHGRKEGHHAKAYSVRDSVAMPPELKAALASDSRARKAFEALPPGEQKAYRRWVAWAKQATTRAARARDAMLLIVAGRKHGETDMMAARRGVASKAEILGRAKRGK